MDVETDYELSATEWKGPSAQLHDCDDTPLAVVPLRFVQTGGKSVDRVSYLVYVLKYLISTDQEIRLEKDSKPVHADDPIEGGVYVMVNPLPGNYACKPGPQGQSRFRLLSILHPQSSESYADELSEVQIVFREKLCLRDGGCLITGDFHVHSTAACHIVPRSLGQSFLNTLTEYPYEVGVFSPPNGITLNTLMQFEFEAFQVGIFINDEDKFIVHSFSSNAMEHHGKEIVIRCEDHEAWPHPALVRWHYQQCLMRNFRGLRVPIPIPNPN